MPCSSRRRAACHPRLPLVVVPELRRSSSSHAVRIAAPDGPVRTQLVRAPKLASHRAAVRRPVSGVNRRPECFLQTSTLVSSPSRPEPFPGCRRDHVRVHLHEHCCSLPSTPSAGAEACSRWSLPSVSLLSRRSRSVYLRGCLTVHCR
jgi:hypothetical protein